MRLKRANTAVRVCALVSFIVLSATSLSSAPALALPEGRTYEMVSPVYKGGYSANAIVAVAPDGESIVFASLGAFAGDPAGLPPPVGSDYIAHRGPSGWSTAPLSAPAQLVVASAFPIDYSPTLGSSLSEATLGPNSGASYEGQEAEFLLHTTSLPDFTSNFEVIGEVLKLPDSERKSYRLGIEFVYDSASSNFSHIVFQTTPGEFLLSNKENPDAVLYDLDNDTGGESLRLVGLNNKHAVITTDCLVRLGFEGGRGSQFNAVSGDGTEVFFTTGVTSSKNECTEHEQLFVRLGDEKTVELSKPVSPPCAEVPCAGAEGRASAQFQGANEAGTLVFFTTPAPLAVGEDIDSKNDLYMARIECPGGGVEGCKPAQREVRSLVQVSHGSEPAEVQNVVKIAPDGSRVYFVARGILNGAANPEGNRPRKGADNLYVYDSASGAPPVFIADLCSASGLSGEAEDLRCQSGLHEPDDTGLWTSMQPEAQVNVCSRPSTSECAGERETGRFLVFSSYAQLTADDTDKAKDVYRYDALTGTLNRISGGEEGYDGNGNSDAFDATITPEFDSGVVSAQRGLKSRAVSEDGSRVVFSTAEPLSRAAGNGLANVYEWHKEPDWSEGKVSLVSTGSSDQPVGLVAVISSTGRDIFFTTTQGLVSQDTDGQADVYDARLGGGFPQAAAPPESCSGDGCQGPLTNPAPLLVPGSVSQAPGENYPSPALKPAKKKSKPASKRTRGKKGRRVSSKHKRRTGKTKRSTEKTIMRGAVR
jgi:hypothetical protein